MERTGELKHYFRRHRELLPCPPKDRRRFLADARRMAEDFRLGNPGASPSQITAFLGDPKELARGYLDTLDQESLLRYQRLRKYLGRGVLLFLIFLCLLTAAWAFHLFFRPIPMVTSTETLIIYESGAAS